MTNLIQKKKTNKKNKQQLKKMPLTITDLPNDIHDNIALFLPDKDLGRFVCASRRIVVSPYLRRERQRAYWKSSPVKHLVAKGDLAGLQYLHGLGGGGGLDMKEDTMNLSMDWMYWSAKGYLAVVQFLHSIGKVPYSFLVMHLAASNEHLAAVEFLRVMDIAASHGHLGMVQYLHSIGAPCTELAMDLAAVHGHVAVVAYLYNIGAPYTANAKEYAYENGHMAVVEFLTLAIQNTRLRMAVKKWRLGVAQFFNHQ